MDYQKGFHPIYLPPIFYTVSIYLLPVLYFWINQNATDEYAIHIWPLLLPLILGLVNLIVVIRARNKVSRIHLLHCALLIKYSLVPFFITGSLCFVLAVFLMLAPAAFTVLFVPTAAVLFSIVILFSVPGWFCLIGAAPYSIAYIVQSRRQGVHGRFLCVAAGILQFFFLADLLSMMVLTLKEKRCVKITIAVLFLVVFIVPAVAIWLATFLP